MNNWGLFPPTFGLPHPLDHEDEIVVEGEDAVAQEEAEVAAKIGYKVVAVVGEVLKQACLGFVKVNKHKNKPPSSPHSPPGRTAMSA